MSKPLKIAILYDTWEDAALEPGAEPEPAPEEKEKPKKKKPATSKKKRKKKNKFDRE